MYSTLILKNVSSPVRAGYSVYLHGNIYFVQSTQIIQIYIYAKKIGVTCSNLALIEESLVILGLTGGTWVGYAKSYELTDVPVLVSL